MKRCIVMVMSLIALLAATSGYAQAPPRITAKIAHPFTVGKSVLPAGQYDFVGESKPRMMIRIVSEGKNIAYVPVLTQLAAAIHTTPKDAHIVFDKVGDRYWLSEIWIPGHDGYMLLSTKEKHEHEVLDVQR